MAVKLAAVLLFLTSGSLVLAGDLPEVLTGDDLTNLVKEGKRVVANFVINTDAESVKAAAELTKVHDALLPDPNVVVGFVRDPEVHLKYGVAATPSVIYFRDGVPILYTDDIKADQIVEFVHSEASRSSVELNDDTFEHLTQASTGATTGDWLVVFQDPEEIESNMLIPTIEAAAAVLKGRINVAIVDVNASPGLVEQFSIEDTPVVYIRKEGTEEWVGFEDEVTLDSILAFIGEEEESKESASDIAKEKLKKTKEKLDKLAEKVADGAKKFASEAKVKLSDSAQKAKEKIKEQAAKASATLKEGAEKAREKLKEGAQKAREILQDKEAQKKIGIGSSVVIGAVVLIVVVVCVRRRKKKEKTQ